MNCSTAIPLRRYPLFPGCVLISLDDAEHPAISEARGLRRIARGCAMTTARRGGRRPSSSKPCAKPRPKANSRAHARARPKGHNSRRHLRGVEATVARSFPAKTLEVLMPLFGGTRVTVMQAAVARP